MLKFNFEAEDFDVQELLSQFNLEPAQEGITVEVVSAEKAADGKRPFWVDVLSVITVANVSLAVLTGTIAFLVREGLTKLKEQAFGDPYILVRFINGGKKKIEHDKGPTAIAEELVELVSKGEVVSIEFKY